MIFRATGEVGVVEKVVEQPPGSIVELAITLKDGSKRQGKPGEFRRVDTTESKTGL